MSTTASPMSFAQFEQLPEMPGKQELVDGELITMTPPELAHVELGKIVYRLLLTILEFSRVWPDHTGYRIGKGWIEPDVSVSWPDQRRDDKYFLGAPMIAVEILSPGEDIERKLTLYFAEGALEVWIFDPRRKSMIVYLRTNAHVMRIAVDDQYRSEAIGLNVRLSQLFA